MIVQSKHFVCLILSTICTFCELRYLQLVVDCLCMKYWSLTTWLAFQDGRPQEWQKVDSWLFFYWLWSKILRKWCLFFTDDCVIWMQTNLWCMISIQKTRKTRIRRLARALNPRSRMFLRSVISECCVSLEC